MRGTVAGAISVAAEKFGLSVDELRGRRRSTNIVEARHVAMWLARLATAKSLPQIGLAFDRDHTTILHGIDRVTWRRGRDPEFAAMLDGLAEKVRSERPASAEAAAAYVADLAHVALIERLRIVARKSPERVLAALTLLTQEVS